MKKLFALLFLLAIFKPVFLDEAAEKKEEASEKTDDAEKSEEAEEAEEAGEAEEAEGAPSNRYLYYPRYNYYDHGYHHHYGYYGCCDMNFYGRRACCYNRPWSACCGNAYYNNGHHDHHDHHDHDDHEQKELVLKTQHSHFDSNILSSSKSTVSLGY